MARGLALCELNGMPRCARAKYLQLNSQNPSPHLSSAHSKLSRKDQTNHLQEAGYRSRRSRNVSGTPQASSTSSGPCRVTEA